MRGSDVESEAHDVVLVHRVRSTCVHTSDTVSGGEGNLRERAGEPAEEHNRDGVERQGDDQHDLETEGDRQDRAPHRSHDRCEPVDGSSPRDVLG